MKILYFDFFLGVELKMLVGAAISLLEDRSSVETELKDVFPYVKISYDNVKRCGLEAVMVDLNTESDDVFCYEKALEFVDLNISDKGAMAYLKSILNLYFEADGALLIKEKEICLIYVLYLILKKIDAQYVISSPIKEGSGFFEKDGGYFIIPSYAAAEIFKTKNIPVKTVELERELTGALSAAVLSVTANEYGTMPQVNIEKIAYGAGVDDLSMPNLMRIIVGTTEGNLFEKIFESMDLFAEISDEVSI